MALEQWMVHRAPMLLLDELIEHGQTWAISRMRVRPDCPFIAVEGLPAWVGIELMAQTISLLAGLNNAQQGQAPKIGFLLGTRKYLCSVSHFPVDTLLSIRVDESYIGDNFLGQYECIITSGLIKAQAKLNVFQSENLDISTQ